MHPYRRDSRVATPTASSLLLALLCAWSLPGCKKKYRPNDPLATSAQQPPVLGGSFTDKDAAPNAGSAETQLFAVVRVNGHALPDWIACEAVAFDVDSQQSTRGRGPCGKFVKFESGNADVQINLKAGTESVSHRFATRDWPPGSAQVEVDIPFAVGRIHIKRSGDGTCEASVDGLTGDVAAGWLVARSGTYTARFRCQDAKGAAFQTEVKVEAIADHDNEVTAVISGPTDTTTVRSVTATGVTQEAPQKPESSEQFPAGGDYKAVPETRGNDLPVPKGGTLPDPINPPLPEPAGRELSPATRVNP